MTFFFDANLSVQLVRGLREFGEDVAQLTEHFPEGEADEAWLREIGARGWFLVTRDERLRWRPAEKAALTRQRVGAFFLGGNGSPAGS